MNRLNQRAKLKEILKDFVFSMLIFLIVAVSFLLVLHLRAYAATGDTVAEARQVEKVPETPVHEYTEIFKTATDEDYKALEQVVYWESAIADCQFAVNKAVVETVCNRVLDPAFPNTISEVCKQKHQFVCKSIPKGISDYTAEAISDAIAETVNGGRIVLPSTRYEYFATKKQRCATNHIWIGDTKSDGTPKKGKGMYFAEAK